MALHNHDLFMCCMAKLVGYDWNLHHQEFSFSTHPSWWWNHFTPMRKEEHTTQYTKLSTCYLHIFWFFSFSSILCIFSDEKKKIYPKKKTAIYQFHHFADALAIFASMMLPPSSPDFFRVSDVVERTLVGNFRSLDSHHPLLAWAITLGMSLTSLRVCSLS